MRREEPASDFGTLLTVRRVLKTETVRTVQNLRQTPERERERSLLTTYWSDST